MALPTTPQPLPPPGFDMDEINISRLAREIARDLRPLEMTLEMMKISSEQWERIQHNPIFSTRLIEEAQVWAASTKMGIRDRIATKAAAAVEELLMEAIGMVQDNDLPGVARVQALQFLAKLGQLGDGSTPKDDGSGRVQINILIGGKKVSFEKDTDPKIVEGQAELVTPGVSQ